MSKAADAFRTISEVGTELAVPKHVLRFWEAKFPQIRPMKRGGGRRYYRPSDMELLRGIRHLLHAEGYTIKGVQKILREQGIDAVKRFGRDEPVAAPAEARGRRTLRLGGEPASTPSATSARAATAKVPSGDQPANTRELVAKMISELEACRRILQADATTEQSVRGTRRPRAARG